MHPILEIIEAKYLHDHVIWVKFNNDEEFEIDFSPMLEEDNIGIFEPLKEIEFFRNFHVDYTLCWENEIDVAPEYIYFLAHKNDPEYQKLFKEWGYIN